MKKNLFLKFTVLYSLVTVFSFCTAQAQTSFLFLHAVGGVPVDESTKNRYSAAFGAEAGYGIGNVSTFFIASLGYLSCNADSTGVKTESYIPLKIGIRQYFTQANIFFADANFGAGFVNNSEPTKRTPSPSTIRLAVDVGIGAKLKNFEAAVNFDTFKEPKPDGSSGWIELKLGYNFSLSKK